MEVGVSKRLCRKESERRAANLADIQEKAEEVERFRNTRALILKKRPKRPKPEWRAPWKLMRVISGHLGWVRAIAMDPTNEWFATGAADRTIKVACVV